MPFHTCFEVADADKTILLNCIIWRNCILHIVNLPPLLEFWRPIRIIDCRLWVGVSRRVIPMNWMIVRIGMRPWLIMICIVPFHDCASVISYLGIHPITALKCTFDLTRHADIATVVWFVRIRSPFSAVGAAAALPCPANQVRLYCITFRAICPANQEIFQIIFTKRLFCIKVTSGTSFIVYIDDVSFHFRKRRVIADDLLRFDASQHFAVAG